MFCHAYMYIINCTEHLNEAVAVIYMDHVCLEDILNII